MELKLNRDPKRLDTDGFVNDLFEGYIKPKDTLTVHDAARVRAAVDLIKEFETILTDNDLLEVY